ncbi:hypothetical protein [Nonomuraea dietziae]|uniref:hypothetical protein n=1 Tax=Nonomuraea dietziae TaxID=65515 RepID=UPI0031D1D7C5
MSIPGTRRQRYLEENLAALDITVRRRPGRHRGRRPARADRGHPLRREQPHLRQRLSPL